MGPPGGLDSSSSEPEDTPRLGSSCFMDDEVVDEGGTVLPVVACTGCWSSGRIVSDSGPTGGLGGGHGDGGADWNESKSKLSPVVLDFKNGM